VFIFTPPRRSSAPPADKTVQLLVGLYNATDPAALSTVLKAPIVSVRFLTCAASVVPTTRKQTFPRSPKSHDRPQLGGNYPQTNSKTRRGRSSIEGRSRRVKHQGVDRLQQEVLAKEAKIVWKSVA
jgi:hypothetical protein